MTQSSRKRNSQTDADNINRCLKTAIDLLSRREHSRLELRQKLRQKPHAEGVDLEPLLDQLAEANYQSDERYAESFVRSRVLKGQGEMKIRQLLLQRGVAVSLAEKSLAEAEVNWWELAEQQREKRFGPEYPTTRDEQVRQSRFLLSRGFPGHIVREVTQA